MARGTDPYGYRGKYSPEDSRLESPDIPAGSCEISNNNTVGQVRLRWNKPLVRSIMVSASRVVSDTDEVADMRASIDWAVHSQAGGTGGAADFDLTEGFSGALGLFGGSGTTLVLPCSTVELKFNLSVTKATNRIRIECAGFDGTLRCPPPTKTQYIESDFGVLSARTLVPRFARAVRFSSRPVIDAACYVEFYSDPAGGALRQVGLANNHPDILLHPREIYWAVFNGGILKNMQACFTLNL